VSRACLLNPKAKDPVSPSKTSLAGIVEMLLASSKLLILYKFTQVFVVRMFRSDKHLKKGRRNQVCASDDGAGSTSNAIPVMVARGKSEATIERIGRAICRNHLKVSTGCAFFNCPVEQVVDGACAPTPLAFVGVGENVK